MAIHYHQSGLRLFADCPHAWWLSYVAGEPQVTPETWQSGREIHDGLRRYAQVCWRDGRRPVKRDEDAMKQIALGYEGQDVRDSLLWFAKEVAWEWGDASVWTECPVEQALSATLPCGEVFDGRLDLVTCLRVDQADDPFGDANETGSVEQYMVVDWKSRVPQKLLEGDRAPLQLRAYAWLLTQHLGRMVPVTVTYIEVAAPYLRHDAPPRVWRLTDNDIAQTEAELDALVVRIKDMLDKPEAFEPAPGGPCHCCNVVAACKYSKTQTVAEYGAMSPAERAARWGALEGLRKQLDPMVKADSGGVYYWAEESGIKTTQAREFAAFCAEHGVDAASRMGLTPTAVKESLDKLPVEAQLDAIEKGLVTQTTSRKFVPTGHSTLPAAECQEKHKPAKTKTMPEPGNVKRLQLEVTS